MKPARVSGLKAYLHCTTENGQKIDALQRDPITLAAELRVTGTPQRQGRMQCRGNPL